LARPGVSRVATPIEKLALPLLVPNLVQNPAAGSGCVPRCRALSIPGHWFVNFHAPIFLAQMIQNTPARYEQKPALERPVCGSYLKCGIWRATPPPFPARRPALRCPQAASASPRCKSSPIGVEKVLPAFLVVPLLQTTQQAAPVGMNSCGLLNIGSNRHCLEISHFSNDSLAGTLSRFG